MKNIDNIQFFIDSYDKEKFPMKLYKLFTFTLRSNVERNFCSLLFFNIKKTDNDDYLFKYNDKEYHFKVFSDYKLQQVDKKILTSEKRKQNDLNRTLKLACSMDLVNPRVAIGNSVNGILSLVIIFYEDGIDKVIDYSNNLVMNKDDYYEIFKFEELNVVDKFDLYNIYYMLQKTDSAKYIYEYLLFTKEIFNDLSKTKLFSFFADKYDSNGINKRNYTLYGDDSDVMFFNECDSNFEYKYLQNELHHFTINPSIQTKHISYDEVEDTYKLEDRKFGSFKFNLLSNMIGNPEVKNELLSEQRYHECHKNSILVAKSLGDDKKKNTYVVAGMIAANENDYFKHSWVEIEDKNIVIDYNQNIVIDKDKYYELMGAKMVSKTLISEIEEAIQTIIFDFGLVIHFLEINYFGVEYLRDLKKNEKILKK